MSSSPEVPASSIRRILSPRRFVPGCGRHPQEWSLYVCSLQSVLFFRSHGVFHSQDSFPSTFRPRLWETSSGVVAVGVFAAECRLLPKLRRLPFSGFLPLDVSSPAVGDILRSGCCRCVRCRVSSSSEVPASSFLRIPSPRRFVLDSGRHPQEWLL